MSAPPSTGDEHREPHSLQDTMAATLAGDPLQTNPHAPPRESEPGAAKVLQGQMIGRYVVLERLGAGAMGVVLAAYDPELDRKVALKLLHPHQRARRSTRHQLRLLAEAQALARLSDPHVVAIHDAGTHEGKVFLAMEFIEGQTLREWLTAARRPWAEVLDVMVSAARGLAAAHARDLIHRDFKPDNVMIDRGGRVRVMDFGLARVGDDTLTGSVETSAAGLETSQPRTPALDLQLTDHGTMLGTPAYMAPECIGGERGSPAADQFSFCVTLFESLYGQRPFPAKSLPELYGDVLNGTITPPPAGSGVPRWLRHVVERGLAVEPAYRWPSMRALLRALERGRSGARARRWAVAVAAVGALGACAWGGHRYQQLRQQKACDREGASIEQVWNESVAAGLQEALESSGDLHVVGVVDRARPWIDAHAQAWAVARTDACVQAEVHQRMSRPQYQRAQWCLDERRMELEALLSELAQGGAQRARAAVIAAARLRPIGSCTSPEALARLPSLPADDQREQLRDVRAELWRARAMHAAGSAQGDGVDRARALLARAEGLGWPPVVADARLLLAFALFEYGEYAQAEPIFEQVYFDASRAEAPETAFKAASNLVGLLGYRLARHDEALRWAKHAQLILDRLPGDQQFIAAPLLMDVSTTHFSAGDYDRALEVAEQIVEIYQTHLGPGHPLVGDALTNLGVFHEARGDYAEAKALYEHALELDLRSLGEHHPTLAKLYANLGNIAVHTGDPEQARAFYNRALSVAEATLGPKHALVGNLYNNLASVANLEEDHERARELFERALRFYERSLSPEHPQVAATYGNLAQSERQLGDLAGARAHYEQSLRIYEALQEPDHPDVAYPLQGLGTVAATEGRYDEAIPLLERAVLLREQGGVGSGYVAEARFALAKALWDQGLRRAEARAEAQRALELYREHPERHDELITAIEQWQRERALVEHQGPKD